MSDAARASRLMTIDEWAALDQDESGELVEGFLVEEEDVGFLHETLVTLLAFLLRGWLQQRGRVAGSDAKFAVSSTRGRKPDLTVYFTRARLPRRSVIRTPPDVVIEIVTPTARDRRRDRVEKLGEYAGFGVQYYWLVDPEAQTFEVLALGADQQYRIALSRSEGTHPIPGCDGLEIDIDALWSEVADLGDDE